MRIFVYSTSILGTNPIFMYPIKKFICLSILTVCMFGEISCSFKQNQILFESKGPNLNQRSSDSDAKTHLIKPQDLLQVRNLQNRSLIVNEAITTESGASVNTGGQNYLVEADSTVALPMLGHVKVAGLTRIEAAKRIEALYSKELKNPIIELKIVNLKVTLLGEIKNQGIYNLEKDYTSLIEIIGAAGGLTEKANSKNIKIIRGDLQAPQVIDLDLSDIKTLSDSRMILRNNDIIYISQNKKSIRSEKFQAMSVVLQPVIALLNTALIIYTLSR